MSFISEYLEIIANDKDIILQLAYVPESLQVGGGDVSPDIAQIDDILANFVYTVTNYVITKVIVWYDMLDFSNISDYLDFYNLVYDAIKEANSSVKVYGPSCDISDTSMITDFIDGANGFDGIAVTGSYTDSQWAGHVTTLKGLIGKPLVVNMKSGTSGSPILLNESLDSFDIVLWPSDDSFTSPRSNGDSNWQFNGNLTLHTRVNNFTVFVDSHTPPLGNSSFITFYQDGDAILSGPLPVAGQSINLGSIGTLNTRMLFTFKVTGSPAIVGSGQLKLTFKGDGVAPTSVRDTVVVTI